MSTADTTTSDQARMDLIDALAEALANAIQAGATQAEIRADIDACLSVQMWDDEPDLDAGNPETASRQLTGWMNELRADSPLTPDDEARLAADIYRDMTR